MSGALADGKATSPLLYFGKVPCRGDFVRSAQHHAWVDSVDRWQSQAIERVSLHPHWKRRYDAAPPVSFALVSNRGVLGLAGHWLASQDASGRRFPFVTAVPFEPAMGREPLHLVPLALQRTWTRLEQVARVTHAATDLTHAQASLQAHHDLDVCQHGAQVAFIEFIDTQTLAGLTQMLAASGQRIDLRTALLAVGLLLQPAIVQGASRLTRLLRLPLPGDPATSVATAAFWLALVQGFFVRHDVEYAVFVRAQGRGAELCLGFQGASPAHLAAVIGEGSDAEAMVTLGQADWVEDELVFDAGLRKLSNYLRDPGLSLAQAINIHREVFLGV